MKTTKNRLIASASALALCGTALTSCGLQKGVEYSENQLMKQKSPIEYYTWVMENATEKNSKEIKENCKEIDKRQQDGITQTISLGYKPSGYVKESLAKALITGDSETDDIFGKIVDNFSSIAIQSKFGKSKDESNLSLGLNANDNNLLSIDIQAPNDLSEIFARVPELNETWLKFSLDSLRDEMGVDFDEIRAALTGELSDYQFTSDQLADMYSRYATVLWKSVEGTADPDKDGITDVTAEIGGKEVAYTSINFLYTRDEAVKMCENMFEELKGDSTIKEFVEKSNYLASEDLTYEEAIDKELESFKETIDDSDDTDSEPLHLSVYVNDIGGLAGFNITGDEIDVNVDFLITEAKDKSLVGSFEITSDGDTVGATLVADKNEDDTYTGSIDVVTSAGVTLEDAIKDSDISELFEALLYGGYPPADYGYEYDDWDYNDYDWDDYEWDDEDWEEYGWNDEDYDWDNFDDYEEFDFSYDPSIDIDADGNISERNGVLDYDFSSAATSIFSPLSLKAHAEDTQENPDKKPVETTSAMTINFKNIGKTHGDGSITISSGDFSYEIDIQYTEDSAYIAFPIKAEYDGEIRDFGSVTLAVATEKFTPNKSVEDSVEVTDDFDAEKYFDTKKISDWIIDVFDKLGSPLPDEYKDELVQEIEEELF